MSDEKTALTTTHDDVPGQTVTIVPGLDFGVLIPTEQELAVYELMAKKAASTQYYNKLGGEAGVISIMLYARELGIKPMTAISGGLMPIQGKVEMSARMMNVKIREAKHELRLIHLDDISCKIAGKRRDTGEEQTAEFTLAEADKAGLIKKDSNWEKYTQDMLWARAISRLARRLFPDVIGSAYVEGEIRYEDDPIDVKPMTRRRKAQTVVTPKAEENEEEETSTPEEVKDKEPNKEVAQPKQEEKAAPPPADKEKKKTAKEEEAPPPPAKEEVPVASQKEAAKRADPEVLTFLKNVRGYLAGQRKLPQEKMEEADTLISREFHVDYPELVPAAKLDALQAYCRRDLLAKLQQEGG